MRIGIFGSGLMGGKLGAIFARAAHEVEGGPEVACRFERFGKEGRK